MTKKKRKRDKEQVEGMWWKCGENSLSDREYDNKREIELNDRRQDVVFRVDGVETRVSVTKKNMNVIKIDHNFRDRPRLDEFVVRENEDQKFGQMTTGKKLLPRA